MIDLIAFCDSESSGLFRKDLDEDNPAQPNLLELAVKVTDSKRRLVRQFSAIIRPDGWGIEPEALEKHGITEEYAYAVGVPLDYALGAFKLCIDGVRTVVGHGIIGFDYPLIALSIKRAKAENLWWRSKASKLYDTAEKSAKIVGIPSQQIPGESKYPTLEEACHFFGCGDNLNWYTWKSSHRAVNDIEATEYVYSRIKDHERRNSDSQASQRVPPFARTQAAP